jgi:pyruvate/2-oxoglutarate dehydrogenase complex dihydrolipoamide acyltransferase (E2) component
MSNFERVSYSAMRSMKRNFSLASFRLKDCSKTLSFLEQINSGKTKLIRITFAALLICAIGKTLEKHPRLGWMKRGWKWIKPSTADVGCSIGTSAAISPVVVIQDVNHKSFDHINRELLDLGVKARQEESRVQKKIGQMARLIPLKWLLHSLVKYGVNKQPFIRHKVGNFQVSILSHPDSADLVVNSHQATSLLIVGKMKDQALVENGEVVIRPAAHFCLHMDHSLHGAQHAVLFMGELFRLLDNPKELR